MNFIDLFDRSAAEAGDRLCVADEAGAFGYAEAGRWSHHVARGLLAGGLAPEGKAAVLGPNCAGSMLATLGIIRAGGAWLPLNLRNALPDTIGHMLRCDAEWLFVHSSLADETAAIRAACPGLKGVVSLDDGFGDVPALLDWAAAHAGIAPDLPTEPGRVIKLASTGGTTGVPKGVMHTNLSVFTMVSSLNAGMPYDAPPTYLCPGPISHAAGNVALSILAVGGTIRLMARPDPARILDDIERVRANALFVPPTLLYRMIDEAGRRTRDYRSLRYLMYGAAPVSTERLKAAIATFGPVMTQWYGLAEATMALGHLSPADHVVGDPALERRLASVGRPPPLTRVEILADDGTILGPEAIGEVAVRGFLVSAGYYGNPEATAETFARDWLRTADVGFKDADGFLYLVDRKRDMIITGGFNVYPSEIEQVIMGHPAVAECAVVGVPDETWGEAVKAVVELRPGARLDAAELIALCKDRLGGVKAPKSVDVWDQLPRTPAGKIRKVDVRKAYWEGRERALTF